jgi:serine/threonine-protein kinase
MHAIINEDPTPSIERGAGDKSLWEIIQRGLRKQREERFQSVTELGEAMALWLYEHGIKEDLSGNSIRAVWLDPAMASVPEMPSARPSIDASNRPTGSRVPTARAAAATGGAITLAPSMLTPARRRMLVFALPAFALVAGLLGAWLVVSMQRAPAAEIQVNPGVPPVPKAPAPQPAAVQATPAPAAAAAEPPPATAATSKSPSPGTSTKPKHPVVATRKKGHDFGF